MPLVIVVKHTQGDYCDVDVRKTVWLWVFHVYELNMCWAELLGGRSEAKERRGKK